MITKTDHELVREVMNGSLSSFEDLIERYQKTIFNLVAVLVGDQEDAKDITQDIFVKAFEKMDTFNFKYKFFSWLYRIAINESLTWKRRNPRMSSLHETEFTSIPANQSESPETGEYLKAGLSILPHNYQTLLILKYLCDLSYEEIAEISKISVKKVRSRLFIAREKLRLVLIEKGYPEYE